MFSILCIHIHKAFYKCECNFQHIIQPVPHTHHNADASLAVQQQ